jgi:hypothetical protein
VSGKGAIGGVIVVAALAFYALIGVDWSALASFGMAGQPPSTGEQIAWLAFLSAAVAAASVVTFATDGTTGLRSAIAGLGGHAGAVLSALAFGGLLVSLTDSLVVVVAFVAVVGVSLTALLVGRRPTMRLGVVAVALILGSQLLSLAGGFVTLVALPALIIVAWSALSGAPTPEAP